MSSAHDAWRDPSVACSLLRDAANALLGHPGRRGSCVDIPARGRLLASGDLHDNPVHFEAVQRMAGLAQSPDRHATVHELIHGERLINGADLSHRMVLRVAEWVLQYPLQVHPLLANHELSQLTGRGVSKGAGDSVKLFNAGLDFVYADAADEVHEAVNEFFRAMPLALRVEGRLLCAHALPSPATMRLFEPGVLLRSLTPDDLVPPRGAAYLMTWGREWSPEIAETLAAAWGVEYFVLGHQFVENGIERVGQRIIVLNTDHQHGMVLPVDLEHPTSLQRLFEHAVPIRSGFRAELAS